ncbi:DUF4309 domain-containing protein [Planococcus sp. NCCP-2050]|uniref:DUF4309 domain-containing protein n=1 Tax=Planococcus sp. NCCP-2050 TaxID=2944679 RepID=UPI002041CD10|nr:DUF4309 domain-containing protein [Planococcus sp. NCCP-2050]GKW45549.1 hypothetical protein NCCP2050_12410 [Planococcus sp. NCCP-2050]
MRIKFFTMGAAAVLAIGLAACSDEAAGEAGQSDLVEPSENAVAGDTDETEDAGATDEKPEETGEEISGEQKQMAIETLKGIVKDAEKGVVYRFASGFTVGESTREEVYAEISKPEEQTGEFDFYHGSMGQASYQIKYDENEVMQEARYFGTNVERQTNLGGITKEDLIKEIGKPEEERAISATGETNIVYQIGDYELQFILGEDGTADHVNLLKKSN